MFRVCVKVDIVVYIIKFGGGYRRVLGVQNQLFKYEVIVNKKDFVLNS